MECGMWKCSSDCDRATSRWKAYLLVPTIYPQYHHTTQKSRVAVAFHAHSMQAVLPGASGLAGPTYAKVKQRFRGASVWRGICSARRKDASRIAPFM